MKVKEESEKAGLKFNIQQRSWHLVLSNHGKQMGKKKIETVTEFIFLGPKITVDGDCSHEIKRCFLLGRKAMTNIESILKSRDIALPTKVHIIKAFFFFFSSSHAGQNSWESPLDCKEIKPVSPKGNHSSIFIGRIDAEEDDEGEGMKEDEMIGWHHWLNEHEFEQALGDRTGKPGVLKSMGLQRVGHDWATEQQNSNGINCKFVVIL